MALSDTATARRRTRWRSAYAGVGAASAGVGVAEIIAALISPRSSPIAATGSLVIDLSPAWLKDLVISLFGTADKVVIIVVVALVVVALAAAAGIAENAAQRWGRILLVAVGSIGFFAAITRADSSTLSAVPALIAILISVVTLGPLCRKALVVEQTSSDHERELQRRSFLISTSLAAGFGLIAAVGGRVVATGAQAADVARRMFTLPAPAVVAAPIPAGASLGIAGVVPLVTPNADFYRIDTALIIPSIDPERWELRITGMVDREVRLTFDELLALPLEESYTTLACVSNYVGGGLIGNALWLGYPIRNLLAKAGVQSGADMMLSQSIDGFTAGTPLPALTDDRNSILAVAMNGKPLPAEHGFPVRMVVPGLFGYVSATKWVTELKVTRFADEAAYWTNHGWSALGPVKLSSRIDTPRDSFQTVAGTVMVAGVAWSQHVGLSGVEVRVDDGRWQEATLAEAISADTWRQWSFPWKATSGKHFLSVRATDANGVKQIEQVADVVPDGATGLHSIFVNVS